MSRSALLELIRSQREGYDVIVIGGGATGAGLAWDAAGRGLSTLLLEAADFGHGTSSRSTKLIHGGIRYLAQGQVGLVYEALRERRHLLARAAAHVRPLSFVLPVETLTDHLKYRAGLALYALLGRLDGDAVAPAPTAAVLASLRGSLRGAHTTLLHYLDARFDDTRLLLAVLGRATAHGARVLNYARVIAFAKHRNGQLAGVCFEDRLSGRTYEIAGRAIINAAGPEAAAVATLDHATAAPAMTLSRGSHVVVSRECWPHDEALLMPRTPDGRVMFAIPWYSHVLLGTTDVVTSAEAPWRPSTAEVDEILAVSGSYLARAPTRRDVRASFAGVRPLAGAAAGSSARVSREYQLATAESGLISLYGGKWTTFRRMAEAGIDAAIVHRGLSATRSQTAADELPAGASLLPATLQQTAETPADSTPLVAGFTGTLGDVARAVRDEQAHGLEDVLARRLRLLFVDTTAARHAAPAVAAVIAREHGKDAAWVTAELARFEDTVAAFSLPQEVPPAGSAASPRT